jgi:hypothetical protein
MQKQNMKQTEEAMKQTAQTMADTIVEVINKFAGTKSDLKLSFEDLTIDAGAFKAKMTGAVVLDVVLAKQAEGTGYKTTS